MPKNERKSHSQLRKSLLSASVSPFIQLRLYNTYYLIVHLILLISIFLRVFLKQTEKLKKKDSRARGGSSASQRQKM